MQVSTIQELSLCKTLLCFKYVHILLTYSVYILPIGLFDACLN